MRSYCMDFRDIEVLFDNLIHFIDPEKVSLTFLLAANPDDPQFFEKDVKIYRATVIHRHNLDRL